MCRRMNFLFILMVFIFLPTKNVIAWDDKSTHKDISTKAVEDSVLGNMGGGYLKNLGFDKGIEEEFILEGTLKTVTEWVKEGTEKEDAYTYLQLFSQSARFFNHFHNPLLSWDQAGLDRDYIVPLPFPTLVNLSGESSLLWAQNSADNEWFWQKIRDYYYLALTSSTDTLREENFAKTFKGVGHLIHLIQDSAQPAHVRNDPHPLDGMGWIEGFESWAVNNRFTASSFMSNPVFPTVSLDTSVGGYTPITQFWDTDQYDGTNPPAGTNIGLSEYTNANFFSEDTINASRFPYPQISDSTPEVTRVVEGSGYERQYYLKNCCGETKGGQGYLLSAVDFLDYYREQYPSLSFALPKIPVLDDNVYEDYASLLLPRAVGYSAGLLNYFFRGDIETTGFSYTSTSVTANIRNDTRVDPTDPNSTIEVMGPGSLEVSYSYIDNQGNTVYGLSDIFNVTSVPSVEDTSLPPLNLTFTLSTPIPPDAVDVSFTFIYRGALGNEADAVVAAPPSTRIVYAHQTGAGNPSYIYSIDPDGRNNIQITNESDGYTWDFDPDLSPDGSNLAFYGEESIDRDIVVVDMISEASYPGNIITILDSGQLETSPAFSPDGVKVAATLDFVYPAQIIIFNVASGTSESIIPDTSIEWIRGISWSPDGLRFVFAGRTSTGTNPDKWDIYTVNTDGTGLTMLTSDTFNDESPAWSPDGSEIAFVSDSNDGTTFDLWIMNAGGTNPLRITDFPFNNHIWSLDWSPDGKQIVFSAGSASFNELYVINLDDKSLYQLTDYGLTSSNSSPSWSYK